jgi:hypothetical protein
MGHSGFAKRHKAKGSLSAGESLAMTLDGILPMMRPPTDAALPHADLCSRPENYGATLRRGLTS